MMYGGLLYPLLLDADGEPMILAPDYVDAKALRGVGMRLLHLAPCSTALERIEQLKALGVVVGDAREWAPRAVYMRDHRDGPRVQE
jgi:hypothetical protein